MLPELSRLCGVAILAAGLPRCCHFHCCHLYCCCTPTGCEYLRTNVCAGFMCVFVPSVYKTERLIVKYAAGTGV
jgi:hypothetical protein